MPPANPCRDLFLFASDQRFHDIADRSSANHGSDDGGCPGRLDAEHGEWHDAGKGERDVENLQVPLFKPVAKRCLETAGVIDESSFLACVMGHFFSCIE